MRIAILSMQRIVNFGSVLQAYSLREMVRQASGETAVFIDIEQEPFLESKRSVKEESSDYAEPYCHRLDVFERSKRWIIRRVSRYNKRLISAFMCDELQLNESNNRVEYDCVIVGSDEVFNHVKGVRLQLHGEVKNAKKVISYAASCGSARAEDIASRDLWRVRKALENFSAVSVRDAGTKQYVESITGRRTLHHMDPVLMGPLHERKPGKVRLKPYLLVYAYGQRIHTREEIDAIRAFAKAKGLLVVAVGGSQYWCDLYIPLTPMQVLDYFSAAEYVVTDTFHGVVFSVLCRKKFGAIVRRSNENKLAGLLAELGLERRHISDMSSLTEVLTAQIDYDRIESMLARERKQAQEYLKEQLCYES